MVVLDATIMNVALPSAQDALDISDADRQWVVTAYALAFGSLLLLGGRISDLVGRRASFMLGLVGFAAASAVGGAAQNFATLVSARVGQGVFAALLAPAALSLLTTTFTDPKERAKAFGVFGALAGTGGAIGLILGGSLTTYASWRWALYVNIVFAAVAFLGATVVLPKIPRGARPKLDLAGTVTASAGLFALVFGFARAETDGWSDNLCVYPLIASGVLLAAFVALQRTLARRGGSPLLPPSIVKDRNRAGSYLAMLVVGAGMFAVFLFLTYYLQVVMGYSAIRTGCAFLPMVAMIVTFSQLTNLVLLPRIGARVLITLGMLICALAMSDWTTIDARGDYATEVLPGFLVMGIGLGLVFSPAIQGAVSGVDRRDAGVASAMVNTMQQVGGSIGIALLSTIAATAAEDRLGGRTPTPALMADAAAHSYVVAFWWACGFLIGGAVLVGLLLRPGVPASVAHGAGAPDKTPTPSSSR
ncbi:MFS transporter [Sporichthya sp.]|uniref:MFS transporter n=1 Tax=Sporichthya sp. TaxID=65475 RepID=UPI0017E65A5E|nr:MFS transporter [Sporichthya sp.]MBA3743466.1 MFS transporter [Sporichthya sp.]